MENKSAMKSADGVRLARLIRQQRWVTLGTLDKKQPYVSCVAWAVEPDFSGFILHLSRLALHTRNAVKHKQVSVGLSEPDDGQGDPQQLARLTLQGRMDLLDGDASVQAKVLYLERFPDAAMRFGFADFSLFRFKPESGRYVEGFASSHRIKPEQLALISTL